MRSRIIRFGDLQAATATWRLSGAAGVGRLEQWREVRALLRKLGEVHWAKRVRVR